MRVVAFLAVALLVLAVTVAAQTETPAATSNNDRYIVLFKDNAVGDLAELVLGLPLQFAYRVLHRLQAANTNRRFAAIQLNGGLVSSLVLSTLKLTGSVLDVIPDKQMQVSQTLVMEAPIWSSGTAPPTGTLRIKAQNGTHTMPPANVNVAILDTGIDLSHPGLSASSGYNCKGSGAASDDHGHGTRVAGVVGGYSTSTQGVIGTAPGTHVIAVKVADYQGLAYMSDLVCGLNWVYWNHAANNIKVALISLSGPSVSDNSCGSTNGDLVHQAVCAVHYAGVSVVAASGNAADHIRGYVPAGYPEVFTATAVTDYDGLPGALFTRDPSYCNAPDQDDQIGMYSNFYTMGDTDSAMQASHIVAAPGTCIRTTNLGGGYGIFSGSSYSAAHAAAVMALCRSSFGLCASQDASTSLATVMAQVNAYNAAHPGYGYSTVITGFTYGPMLWAIQQ